MDCVRCGYFWAGVGNEIGIESCSNCGITYDDIMRLNPGSLMRKRAVEALAADMLERAFCGCVTILRTSSARPSAPRAAHGCVAGRPGSPSQRNLRRRSLGARARGWAVAAALPLVELGQQLVRQARRLQ